MGKSKNELLVLEKVPLKDWYNRFVVGLNKKARVMTEKGVGICPFHDDNDPSLKIWGKKNVFHCFGCGFTGDVIASHMRLKSIYYNEKLSRENTVKELALIWGIELLEEDVAINTFKENLNYIEKDIPNVFTDLNIYSYDKFNNKISKVQNIDVRIKMYQDLDIRLVSKLLRG